MSQVGRNCCLWVESILVGAKCLIASSFQAQMSPPHFDGSGSGSVTSAPRRTLANSSVVGWRWGGVRSDDEISETTTNVVFHE